MRITGLRRLLVCAAAVAATAAGPQVFAAGDPAAKAEAIAAFEKLAALPSFKIKWSSPEGTGLAEIVTPDKGHFSGKSAQGSVEIYAIGTARYIHYDLPGAPTGWRCSTSSRPVQYFDTRKMRTDTTTVVVRKPDAVIDGAPTHVYADAATNNELYVGAQTGLPRRVVDPSKSIAADFYDYGVPITITPPSCG